MLNVGDFRFFWEESIRDFAILPSAWDSSLNTGLGLSQLHSLWITSYFNFTAFFTKFGLDWNIIQILFWIVPSISISFLSAFFLFKHFFKDMGRSIISGVIYTLNTYFLMILSGGQLGVALSYSVVPFVFLTYVKFLEKNTLRNATIGGLALGLQIIFDPRIVLITLLAVFLYSVFNLSVVKKVLKNSLGLFILPFIISGLLNIYWIFPLFLAGGSSIPREFSSTSGFEFFSFAQFSNAISFLHPNWPENIFGKIYFLDPKFLMLPLLAFGSLLFSKNKTIIYFSLLSLLGIFLAKGANPPFGEINIWIFENIPGMSAFRDPSKWFIFVSLGYSILIPFSLVELSKRFRLMPILFVVYLLILIYPIVNQVKVREVPQDYVKLKNLLVSDKTFSRTIWIPVWQRYGFFSNNHPAIGREEVFEGSYKSQIEKLRESKQLLDELSVRYVIVPYDSEGEIFLNDRKYDEKKYETTVAELRGVEWLREVSGFEKIAVFKLDNSKDHFWSDSGSIRLNYGSIKPTEYKVRIDDAKEGDLLVFSEGFDKNWVAESTGFRVQSLEFNRLNGFRLPREGSHVLRVYYEPQKYVEAGLWVSIATLLASLGYILFGKRLKRW